MTGAEAPYRLGRKERRGTVLGARPGQVVTLVLGVAALVAGVSTGGVPGVAAGVAALAACIGVATVPWRGRGLDEWAVVAAMFWATSRRGALCAAAAVMPAVDGGTAALCWPDGTASCFARLSHRGLRALADEPRATGDAIARWLRSLSRPDAPRWSVSLLAVSGPGAPARDAPWASAGVCVRSYVAVSAARPVDVVTALREAGVAGPAEVDDAELAALLSARVAPAAGDLLGTDLRSRWGMLEGPRSVHAAYVIEEWPTGDVDEQLLAPLSISSDRRTLCVTLRVEELRRSRARTARLRTSAAADHDLALGGGFLASPEAALAAARDAERAAELAAGHGSVRMIAAVGLDAEDPLGLEAAAARLEADAARCGVRLRRCDGDHRRGLLATVPGWCVP